MKTEVLLRSIGKINDELIADAESEANTKRKPGWAKLGTMVACLALVLCTGIATHAIRSNATAGTFTMDVNPSVEYTIAKSGIVKNVRCLNSDAENALSDGKAECRDRSNAHGRRLRGLRIYGKWRSDCSDLF